MAIAFLCPVALAAVFAVGAAYFGGFVGTILLAVAVLGGLVALCLAVVLGVGLARELRDRDA